MPLAYYRGPPLRPVRYASRRRGSGSAAAAGARCSDRPTDRPHRYFNISSIARPTSYSRSCLRHRFFITGKAGEILSEFRVVSYPIFSTIRFGFSFPFHLKTINRVSEIRESKPRPYEIIENEIQNFFRNYFRVFKMPIQVRYKSVPLSGD